jgi:hypothetical protein
VNGHAHRDIDHTKLAERPPNGRATATRIVLRDAKREKF